MKIMRGFSLLETLVAIGILFLALLGPLTLASYSINSASLARNQITAFNLASEAMEAVRNKRDTNIFQGSNWLSDIQNCTSAPGCYLDISQAPPYAYTIQTCPAVCPTLKRNSSTGLFNTASGEDTPFTRKVTVTSLSADEIKVKVEISWLEKISTRSFSLETHLFKWH